MKCLIILLLFLTLCNSNRGGESVYKTEYLHSQPGDITIIKTDSQTIFGIHNEFGIGKAKIILIEGSWPSHAILRLHLKGLEGVSIYGSGKKYDKFNLIINHKNIMGQNYFDITLPSSLFTSGKVLHFSWVDFYR